MSHGDQGANSMRGGDPGFYAILDEIAAMHEKKNADYGTGADPYANVNAAAEMGIEPWRAAALRANEKLTRIKAFCINGRLENESLDDSLLDLASYAVIALRLRRKAVTEESGC